MKITYFRLKGYIKILNGMGIDELVIPFSDFKNRIILISGQNGTGKSTIIQALTPNPDSSDSFRTDVFIDNFGNRQIIEYPGEKEIIYEDIDETGFKNNYRILIQSLVDESKTKRTSKAYISKNGEELNPNGNINSFKDIRDSIMGIDPIYLDLSSISSENRGLVDMIPSERRKYMSLYIGSLDTYNKIFKILAKKVSNLKSYMNTINNKIYELGNENELRLQISHLTTQLKILNSKRDQLLKQLSEAETTVKLLDPDNKIRDLYQSILDRLEDINSKLENIDKQLLFLYTNNKIDSNLDFNNEIISLNNIVDTNTTIYNEDLSKISSLNSVNEVTIHNIEEDRSRLLSITLPSIQDNIEKAISDIKKDIDSYKNYLTENDIRLLKSTSQSELQDAKDSFDNFIREIKSAEELSDSDNVFIEGCRISIYGLENKTKKNIDTLKRELDSLKGLETELNIRLISLRNDHANYLSFSSMRPKECRIDTCPYIADFINLNNGNDIEENIKDIENEIFDTKNKYDSLSKDLSKLESAMNVMYRVNTALAFLNKRIFSTVGLNLDKEYLFEKISSHYRFQEFSVIDVLLEKMSVYNELNNDEKILSKLEMDYNSYLVSKSLLDSIQESIDRNTKIMEDRNIEISNLQKDVIFVKNIIDSSKLKIESYKSILDLLNQKELVLKDKDILRDEFNRVKDNLRIIKEKVDSINVLKNDLRNTEDSIKPINDSINQINYALTSIVEYRDEYSQVSDKYEKMTFIRNACSPGNGMGIQSEYIKRYMNDIIIDCNKMLRYMFGGQIQLDIPIINEKQFTIPFYGPGGIIVPDIGAGSTAQKCMISLVMSCIAMMKSSTKYNIPRFDEIDGGLDQDNRIHFIGVLNQVLDFMRSEQCIICSHNSEFDTQNTTRIICSNGGIRVEQ